MDNIIKLLVSIIIFILLIYLFAVNCNPIKKIEPWVNYQQLPYGNIQSGAGGDTRPISFYDCPVYRRPLNYPVCHLVDYPYPHCRTDSF
jgi:hypothetical protein